ncbi:MAG: nucleoside monophosphate kinase [Solirubrobacterales bacterium]
MELPSTTTGPSWISGSRRRRRAAEPNPEFPVERVPSRSHVGAEPHSARTSGSGKGTQGERLQEDFRLPYYATGDILRAAVRDETELGQIAKEYMDRGDLVPDGVIIGVIAERVGGGGRRRLHPRRLPAHRRAGRGAWRGDGQARTARSPPLC